MSSSDRLNNRSLCPFLGTLTPEGESAPCVDYPSIENLCFVGERPDTVMMPDQATFCLSSGYRHCPRLDAQSVKEPARPFQTFTVHSVENGHSVDHSDPVQHAIAEMDAALQARHRARTQRTRRWGWIGAAALFVSIIVCGGTFAAYLGWRLVSADAASVLAGTVTTLPEPLSPGPPPVYIVITATADGAAEVQTNAVPPQQSSANAQNQAFPPAVTATPVASLLGNTQTDPNQGQLSSPALVAPAQNYPDTRNPPNVLVQVPTRRPTPILDLNIVVPDTATATATVTPLPTLTPTPPLGTPVVIFAAEHEALKSGQCTTVSWHVENVRAVYYENLGVDGHGEHKECIRDDAGEYTLTIVLPTGATEYYTVTVGLLVPTETPSPTATYAPVAPPTATWTPIVPTDTPTPDMQYGARLSIDGAEKRNCATGQTCQLELRVTNTSLGIDDISILFEATGEWNVQLCRLDGVCSDSKLTLASVGPSNTALVLMKVEVPKGAAGQTMQYDVRAVSERSGGSARSNMLTIELTGE